MILSGLEIEKRIDKDIIIKPFEPKQLQSNSYNLKLHDELLIYSENILDMKKQNVTSLIKIPKEGFVLQPNKLYLGRTIEYTETHNLVPMLEGRSSIGRLGIFVHITAGFGDVGFCGYWTLEIFCVQPVKIYPFIEICQLYFHTIEGKFRNYSSPKYQNNNGIQASLMYKDFERKV